MRKKAEIMRRAGIILCGGRRSRMGGDKASLPFGRETLLARVLRRLAAMLDTVVVVAAARQPLPPSSRGIIVVRDSLANHGPLEGLRCGLAALSSTHEAALVTGCDVPFLSSAFVDCLFQRLGHAAAAVVYDPPHYWPLPAVYRRDLAPLCARLLAQGRRRIADLFELVPTCRIALGELNGCAGGLESLQNVNTPQDYVEALAAAGFEVPHNLCPSRHTAAMQGIGDYGGDWGLGIRD